MECSGGSGADGFCIQWTVTNNSTGSAGAGVSRIASSNTIHQILFKTYTGGTPGIDWYENNVQQGSTETAAISLRQDVYYWADYNHTASTLNLYYGTSSTKPGSASHTFTSFSFDTTGYYMGFGAATGGATDNHRLKNWTVTFY